MNKVARPYLFLLFGIIIAFGLSAWADGINPYDQRIVMSIGINMILAASLNLINGFTGQFSLGHAGFMSIGAYGAAIFTTMIAPGMLGDVAGTGMQDVALFMGLLFGGIISALIGVLVGIPSLRLKGDYLAIVTLGFGEIIRVIIQNIPSLGGSLGIANIPRYTTFFWVFFIVAIVVFFIQQLTKSTYGQGFLAVRDDEIAAEAMGVNTTRYKVEAFVIGAFFAGVAGGLYGHYNELIRPADFDFLKSVEIIVMVILGGMGSTYGVLFAAALLTYVPEFLRGFELFGVKFDSFRMSIYSLILVILMLTRPQGLFGGINFKKLMKVGRKSVVGNQ